MKGDTSSGQEPISTLVFCEHFDVCPQDFLAIEKLNSDHQLQDNGGSSLRSKRRLFFGLKETQAFLLGTLNSPPSPKQQRNLEQVCAQARVGKWVSVCLDCVCLCVYKSNHQFNFLNIPPCCENSLSFPLCASPPSPSRRFDMLNLLILFFFLLW